MKRLPLLLVLCVLVPYSISAQQWSGVLSNSRAIDWSSAGVVGGIPSGSWTQCGTTVPAGSTAAQVQTAINNCTANHYVLLGPGTFNLTSGITMKAGVVLRGSGANNTTIAFSSTGSVGCGGLGAGICFIDTNGYYYGSSFGPNVGGINSATWTGTNATAGTYTQGATSIRLTGVGSGGIINGQYIYLDQNNDKPTNASSVTSGLMICDNNDNPATDACSLEAGAPGRCSSGGWNPNPPGCVTDLHRNLVQIVKVTAGCASACTGAGPFDVTITPGIYGKKWATGFAPGAWWSDSGTMQNSGVENMTIDYTALGTNATYGIYFNNAFNCWVSGVRSIKANRAHVTFNPAAHITVQNSYFYGVQTQFSTSYGIEGFIGSDNLVINNVFQQNVAPVILGPQTGSVFAYNFEIDGIFGQTNWLQQAFAWRHDAGALYNLAEGNISTGFWEDVFHGSGGANTAYRNYNTGWEPGKTASTVAVQLFSYNRFENFIDNVIGCRNTTTNYPGNCGNPYQTNYLTHSGVGVSGSIYDMNQGNSETVDSILRTVLPDNYVQTSSMLWGNFDVVNNGPRWVTSEVPSTLTDGYANPVPTTTCTASLSCPASFFTTKPGYWNGPWPGIGSDVTGATAVPGVGGHVNFNPAALCFFNTMHGPQDGTGAVLPFDPATCYATAAAVPFAPTGLTATSGATTVVLNWTAPVTPPLFSSYNVYRGTVHNGPYTLIQSGVTNPTYTDSAPPAGTLFYVVTAVNGAGESAKSNESSAVFPATQTVTLTPTTLTYASRTVGTTSPSQTATFTNTSGAGISVSISNVSITGTNAGDFAQTNNCPASLASGSTCGAFPTFTPTAAGARTALLTFTDSATGSPHTITLNGTGIAAAPIVSLNPTSIDFGQQTISTTSTARSTILTNTGTGTLTISSITPSGDFAVASTVPSGGICGGSLAPLATCSIQITFTPTATGGRSGSISIADNAAGSPHVVSLTGTGITTKCQMSSQLTLSGLATICQ